MQPRQPQHKGRAPPTTTATQAECASIGQLRIKAVYRKVRQLNAGTDRIRSVSTDQERVRIMEESPSGYEIENG